MSQPPSQSSLRTRWGVPPWTIDFHPHPHLVPDSVDVAIIGGGFTGLASAAWLRRLAPGKSVTVFEAGAIGSGASGRTGGMTLSETAAGDLPGLGDVLRGFSDILAALNIDCDLSLPGASELGRNGARPDSAISWTDSGELRVTDEVPGGSADPGKLVSGLARAADRLGALILEDTRVEGVEFGDPISLQVRDKRVKALNVLFATNAFSLELSALAGRAEPKFTLAAATAPLELSELEVLGLASRRSFYTVDLPYLWGRLLRSNAIVFGTGLVDLHDWRDLEAIDIATDRPAELIANLERRVRGLHPALRSVPFTHWWGGPVLFPVDWRPVFARHPKSPRALVLAAYAGHGVALSVYLGSWAAEALLGRRDLPSW